MIHIQAPSAALFSRASRQKAMPQPGSARAVASCASPERCCARRRQHRSAAPGKPPFSALASRATRCAARPICVMPWCEECETTRPRPSGTHASLQLTASSRSAGLERRACARDETSRELGVVNDATAGRAVLVTRTFDKADAEHAHRAVATWCRSAVAAHSCTRHGFGKGAGSRNAGAAASSCSSP